MNQSEFIGKMLGKPWVNRAVSWSEVDCYGIVIMYYRHVLGMELPNVTGFSEGEPTDQCWTNNIHTWEQVDTPPTEGLLFTSYKGDRPTHVGIVISPTHVLHCRGSVEQPGKVEVHSIRAIKTVCGRMTYHRFKGSSCQN